MWALIVIIKMGYAGGMTTVGYYDTEARCKSVGNEYVTDANNSSWKNQGNYFCYKVDYPKITINCLENKI